LQKHAGELTLCARMTSIRAVHRISRKWGCTRYYPLGVVISVDVLRTPTHTAQR
jgi:hypothetical protein